MQVRDETRTAFLRWRQHGDLQALTQVFDRTAQELLLVASHLAAPGQEPEDLLQETFLKAIGKADRYDAERPLEPWLLGILVNVTRSHRRRHQRERSLGDLEPGVDATEPVDTVLEDEFVSGLRAAIEGLPVPQREVMTLHLVHGLTATEIAHATSRPLGTVKSWIHRSREELRRRLPVGLLGTFASLLRGMDRLAEVRVVVQNAAVAAAGGIAVLAGVQVGRTVGGGLWLAWAGAAALLLGLGAWWLSTASAKPDPVAVATGPRVAVAASPASPGAAGPEREAAPIATAEAGVDPAPRPTGTLDIRGVRGGSPFAFGGRVVNAFYPDAMLRGASFTTDASGRYHLQEVPYGTYLLQPDRGEGLSMVLDRPELTVTVALDDGLEVRGRVVDAHGHGVAGASIELTGDTLEERYVVGTADVSGAFVVSAIPAGRFLTASQPGWLMSRFCAVPTTDDTDVELRLDEAGVAVDFVVVDPTGAPRPRTMVQLGACRPIGRAMANKLTELRPAWVGVTDDGGRVRCAVAPVGETRVFARGPRSAVHTHMLTVPSGGTSVRIELPHGATVSGVVRGDDGAVLPFCSVRALAGDVPAGPTTPSFCLPACGADAGGRYVLEGVAAGPVLLRVRGGQGIAERLVELHDGERAEWSPRVTADGVVTGRLVALPPATAERLRVELRAPGSPAARGELHADGTFRFERLSERDFELVVLPRAPVADLILLRRFPVRCGDTVELRVPEDRLPLASLRGRALGPSIRSLALTGLGGTFSPDAATDGSFVFDGLPPGRYDLVAGTGQRILWHREVQLDAGGEVDLGPIDAGPTTALSVEVALADRDIAASPVELFVFSRAGLAMVGYARWRGQPAVLELPPGTYQVQAWQGGTCFAVQDCVVSQSASSVRLGPASGHVVELSALPAAPVTSFVVTWELRAADRTLRLSGRRPAGPSLHGGATLRIVLEPGEYEVRARAGLGAPEAMRFTVPTPPGQAPLVMRLR